MHFAHHSGIRLHDLRASVTLGWALVGLLMSGSISLSGWALFRAGPAKAASKQRQLARWLHNPKIQPLSVWRPFVQRALRQWAGETLYLALDSSQLWHRFVIVRLALVYRGRALPLAWSVLPSRSATVALARYQNILLALAALIPADSRVVLLADRGFFDMALLKLARDLGWHFRIRLKRSLWIYRATKGRRKVGALMPAPGEARFLRCVWATQQRFGPLHLALAHVHTPQGYEQWAILSDEPVGLETLEEYGLRFCIEENFLDDKSAGFDLEASEIRCAEALSRLCLILALATFYLVSTGTAIVEMGKRHLVDAHWQRGLSYLQLGWRWVHFACQSGQRLLSFLWLSAQPDPQPAMASRKQFFKGDLSLSHIQCL